MGDDHATNLHRWGSLPSIDSSTNKSTSSSHPHQPLQTFPSIPNRTLNRNPLPPFGTSFGSLNSHHYHTEINSNQQNPYASNPSLLTLHQPSVTPQSLQSASTMYTGHNAGNSKSIAHFPMNQTKTNPTHVGSYQLTPSWYIPAPATKVASASVADLRSLSEATGQLVLDRSPSAFHQYGQCSSTSLAPITVSAPTPAATSHTAEAPNYAVLPVPPSTPALRINTGSLPSGVFYPHQGGLPPNLSTSISTLYANPTGSVAVDLSNKFGNLTQSHQPQSASAARYEAPVNQDDRMAMRKRAADIEWSQGQIKEMREKKASRLRTRERYIARNTAKMQLMKANGTWTDEIEKEFIRGDKISLGGMETELSNLNAQLEAENQKLRELMSSHRTISVPRRMQPSPPPQDRQSRAPVPRRRGEAMSSHSRERERNQQIQRMMKESGTFVAPSEINAALARSAATAQASQKAFALAAANGLQPYSMSPSTSESKIPQSMLNAFKLAIRLQPSSIVNNNPEETACPQSMESVVHDAMASTSQQPIDCSNFAVPQPSSSQNTPKPSRLEVHPPISTPDAQNVPSQVVASVDPNNNSADISGNDDKEKVHFKGQNTMDMLRRPDYNALLKDVKFLQPPSHKIPIEQSRATTSRVHPISSVTASMKSKKRTLEAREADAAETMVMMARSGEAAVDASAQPSLIQPAEGSLGVYGEEDRTPLDLTVHRTPQDLVSLNEGIVPNDDEQVPITIPASPPSKHDDKGMEIGSASSSGEDANEALETAMHASLQVEFIRVKASTVQLKLVIPPSDEEVEPIKELTQRTSLEEDQRSTYSSAGSSADDGYGSISSPSSGVSFDLRKDDKVSFSNSTLDKTIKTTLATTLLSYPVPADETEGNIAQEKEQEEKEEEVKVEEEKEEEEKVEEEKEEEEKEEEEKEEEEEEKDADAASLQKMIPPVKIRKLSTEEDSTPLASLDEASNRKASVLTENDAGMPSSPILPTEIENELDDIDNGSSLKVDRRDGADHADKQVTLSTTDASESCSPDAHEEDAYAAIEQPVGDDLSDDDIGGGDDDDDCGEEEDLDSITTPTSPVELDAFSSQPSADGTGAVSDDNEGDQDGQEDLHATMLEAIEKVSESPRVELLASPTPVIIRDEGKPTEQLNESGNDDNEMEELVEKETVEFESTIMSAPLDEDDADEIIIRAAMNDLLNGVEVLLTPTDDPFPIAPSPVIVQLDAEEEQDPFSRPVSSASSLNPFEIEEDDVSPKSPTLWEQMRGREQEEKEKEKEKEKGELVTPITEPRPISPSPVIQLDTGEEEDPFSRSASAEKEKEKEDGEVQPIPPQEAADRLIASQLEERVDGRPRRGAAKRSRDAISAQLKDIEVNDEPKEIARQSRKRVKKEKKDEQAKSTKRGRKRKAEQVEKETAVKVSRRPLNINFIFDDEVPCSSRATLDRPTRTVPFEEEPEEIEFSNKDPVHTVASKKTRKRKSDKRDQSVEREWSAEPVKKRRSPKAKKIAGHSPSAQPAPATKRAQPVIVLSSDDEEQIDVAPRRPAASPPPRASTHADPAQRQMQNVDRVRMETDRIMASINGLPQPVVPMPPRRPFLRPTDRAGVIETQWMQGTGNIDCPRCAMEVRGNPWMREFHHEEYHYPQHVELKGPQHYPSLTEFYLTKMLGVEPNGLRKCQLPNCEAVFDRRIPLLKHHRQEHPPHFTEICEGYGLELQRKSATIRDERLHKLLLKGVRSG